MELPIFSSALEMRKVTRHTNATFNSVAHLNMQLLLDKMNLQEVRSCFEAVSYLLFLTVTKVVSRKSTFTKYLTPRMKPVLRGSGCCLNSLNTAFQKRGLNLDLLTQVFQRNYLQNNSLQIRSAKIARPVGKFKHNKIP